MCVLFGARTIYLAIARRGSTSQPYPARRVIATIDRLIFMHGLTTMVAYYITQRLALQKACSRTSDRSKGHMFTTPTKTEAALNAALCSLGFVLSPYALLNVIRYSARHAAPPYRCRAPWTLTRREWGIDFPNYTAKSSALAASALVRAGFIFDTEPAYVTPKALAEKLGVL